MCTLCGHLVCQLERGEAGGPQEAGPAQAKPVFSNQDVINQIDSGALWTTGGSVAGTITYGITTNKSWFPSNYGEYSGWSALNSKQAAAANLAIELWDDLIASDITAASNPNSADIRFSNSSTGVNYAHAYYPGETGTDSYSYQKAQGSIWFNPSYTSLSDPDVGEYGFMAVMHEIGHAIGLSHPGVYNGGSPTYANDALYEQDTHMWTVMSYFDAENTGADWYASNGSWKYAQTPMLHDILAIQAIYGADMSTRSGDTVYGFNSTADRSVFDFTQNTAPVLTIWDGDGNDTLDFSGWNTNSQISLVAGTFSHTNSMTHNIAIAFGAEIENAIGGGGNDQITGNDLNNVLRGLGGNDTIDGSGGNDWIDGGLGVDTLLGGAGNDTIVFDASDNLAGLDGGAGVDTLRLDGGSLPVFDLAAHGFEFADHIQTDAGGANWATKTDRYDATWLQTQQDGVNDDGSSWQTKWDIEAQNAWATLTDQYNSAGNRYEQTGTYDNGRTWQTVWDLTASEPWSYETSYNDVSDTIFWNTLELRFDDSNRLYERVEALDDGGLNTIEWDVAGTELWARQITTLDQSSLYDWASSARRYDDQDRLYDQTGTYDDGRTWHTRWDVDGAEAWAQQTTYTDVSGIKSWDTLTFSFDDLDRLLSRAEVRDSGEAFLVEWDVAGAETWSRQVMTEDLADLYNWADYVARYDDQNRLYEQSGTNDDGRVWSTQWDVGGSEAWGHELILQDTGNGAFWSTLANRYDDQGRLYERNGEYDDGRTWQTSWDVDNTETWHRETRIFDTLDNHSWSEQIYEYDESGVLLSQVVIDDAVV